MEILEAIDNNKIKNLKSLLTDNNRIVSINDTVKDQSGQYITTPLIRACQKGKRDIIDILLEHKVNINK